MDDYFDQPGYLDKNVARVWPSQCSWQKANCLRNRTSAASEAFDFVSNTQKPRNPRKKSCIY